MNDKQIMNIRKKYTGQHSICIICGECCYPQVDEFAMAKGSKHPIWWHKKCQLRECEEYEKED